MLELKKILIMTESLSSLKKNNNNYVRREDGNVDEVKLMFQKHEFVKIATGWATIIPKGFNANPDQIKVALWVLASQASSCFAGHNLVLKGGFSIW
tara:strand:- start:13691 stop:13978 length:288 start_codon:yes stop_codon:yes gene_type:complete